MYTLKLDWTEERIEAVTLALREFTRDPGGMPELAPEIRGALADILLYCRASGEAIAEIRQAHPGRLLLGDQVILTSGTFEGFGARIEGFTAEGYEIAVRISVLANQVKGI